MLLELNIENYTISDGFRTFLYQVCQLQKTAEGCLVKLFVLNMFFVPLTMRATFLKFVFCKDLRKSCKNIYYVVKLKYWKFYWIIIVLLHGNNLCVCCYKSLKDFSFRVAVLSCTKGL